MHSHILHWLTHYKYIVIFPIAVFEGPIVSIITGFLASVHALGFWLSYVLIVIADLTGDSFYYSLGRIGRTKNIFKYGKYIGLNKQRTIQIESHFEDHPYRTFIIGKFTHGGGNFVLAAAGLIRFPLRRIMLINFVPTLVKTMILMLVGYYFGAAYEKFGLALDYIGFGAVIIIVALYIYFVKKKKFSRL